MSTICFFGQMTNAGQGATGLTVTIDICSVARSSGTVSSVQNGASATEITTPNARGVYFYRLTGADLTANDYLATFITTGTADLKHVPALWVRFSEADAQTGDSYARLGAPSGASVSADIAALFTTALTESYNTDGAAPTVAQALFLILQMLTEFSISSTTLTVKKLDGSTTAATFTLNSATAPTSITRSG